MSAPRLLAFGLFALLAAPAAASPPAAGGLWAVCANGLMCVRAPCPSINLLNLDTGEVGPIHQIEDAALTPEDSAQLREGLRAAQGSAERRPALGGLPGEEATALIVSALGRATTEAERAACRAAGSPLTRPAPPGAPVLD